MKQILIVTFLFAWIDVCAQQHPLSFRKRPVISLAVGSNMVAFGQQGSEWRPTGRAAVGVGLEMSHKTRGTITPRISLTTDAISTTFQGAQQQGRRVFDYATTITKRYWGARVGVEYDYALTPKWFVGGAFSLAFVKIYDWSIDRSQLPQPKPSGRTVEEELDDMGNSMMPLLCPQFVLGYAYKENLGFRCIVSYESGAAGAGWRYSFPRERTFSINLSFQYGFR